jgi:hypothetical protein
MTQDWTYWRAALEGNFDGLQDGAPQTGYYKRKNRDGTYAPVAVWRDEDKGWLMRVGEDSFVDAAANWNFVGSKPITFTVYEEVLRDGMWPGDIPHGIAHNAPPNEFD